MHASTFLLLLTAVAEVVVGTPLRTRSAYAVKDSHHVPSKWSKVGLPPRDHVINLQVGLKQSQFGELERHLYEGTWRDNARAILAPLTNMAHIII